MHKFFAVMSGALGICVGVSLLIEFIANGGTLILQARDRPENLELGATVMLALIVIALVGNFVVYLTNSPYANRAKEAE